MILGAFGLSYRQLSSFLRFAIGSEGSNHDGSIVHDTLPIFKLCRWALRSVSHSALLIDSTVLIILTLCLNEYWTSIVRPNHMHPRHGYAFPVCWLFESTGRIDDYYWKNLRVEKQRCMDNLISFYGTVGVV
jgi:hypothetical protein